MVAPNIEGTYQLVRRELPDGTVQFPSIVKGMITYTREFRNFSVVWKDEKGNFYSECYAARYTLTGEEYTETQEYLIRNDQIGGKGISYDLSNTSAASPVTVEGGRIRFALPQAFEKALSITVEFDGDKFTATGKELFIDYWERVD
jgi:hypothetical protein